jgi:hypothetical protein
MFADDDLKDTLSLDCVHNTHRKYRVVFPLHKHAAATDVDF